MDPVAAPQMTVNRSSAYSVSFTRNKRCHNMTDKDNLEKMTKGHDAIICQCQWPS